MSITLWLYEHSDHLTIGREQAKPRSQFRSQLSPLFVGIKEEARSHWLFKPTELQKEIA